MTDDEGTWVLKKRKYSIFTWDFGKYKKAIDHSEIFLPGLYIQAEFIKFDEFFPIVVSISGAFTFNFAFTSICIREEPRTGDLMDFTPYDEDEVTREAVSHKLDRPLVNPSNKFSIGSTQTKTPTSTFKIGEYLRYIN